MDAADTLWTDRPDAKAILATCRRNPPILTRRITHYGSKPDVWEIFAGPRAERLEQIREQHLSEITGADWNAADPDAQALRRYLDLSNEQPSVEDAIHTAIEGLHYVSRDVAVPLGAAA